MFNLDPNFIPDFSYLRELQEAPLLPIEASIAQLSRFGHSVQILNPSPSRSGYLNPQVENQNTPNYSHELNNFSIFNLPSAVNKIAFPELISQQQVHTKANGFKLAESSGYSGALTATPGEVYHRAYRRAHKAEMALSGDKDKAKQAGRTAGQAERERVKKSSACGLGESLTITPREAYMRAYHNAYHKAYRAEMASSGDKNKAKQAGQAAGKPAGRAASNAVKKCVKESSTSSSGEVLPPSQLISHKAKPKPDRDRGFCNAASHDIGGAGLTEISTVSNWTGYKGIFTVQIEPISP